VLTARLADSADAEAAVDDNPVDAWRPNTTCESSNLMKGLAVQHLSKQKPNNAVGLSRPHVSPGRTWKLGETISDAIKVDASEPITTHSWVSIPFTATKGESVTFQRTKGSAEARVAICEYYRKKSAASWADFGESDLVPGDSQSYSAGDRIGTDEYTANLFPHRGPQDKSGLAESRIVVVVMIVPKSDVTVAFKLKSIK
jgi:hypothetical protein